MWIVEAKISDDYYVDERLVEGASYEISAVRESNKHGIESWGWNDGEDKIILWEGRELPEKEILNQFQRITKGFCDILNEEGF